MYRSTVLCKILQKIGPDKEMKTSSGLRPYGAHASSSWRTLKIQLSKSGTRHLQPCCTWETAQLNCSIRLIKRIAPNASLQSANHICIRPRAFAEGPQSEEGTHCG